MPIKIKSIQGAVIEDDNIIFTEDGGCVEIADGENIKEIDNITSSNNCGTVKFKGSSIILEGVGRTYPIRCISIGAGGSLSTFQTIVNSEELDLGSGQVIFYGNVAGNIRFSGDGIMQLASGCGVTGNIDNITGSNNCGTVELLGASTICDRIGYTFPIKLVRAGAENSTSIFEREVYAEIAAIGRGIAEFRGDVGGNIVIDGGIVVLGSEVQVSGDILTTAHHTSMLKLNGLSRVIGNVGEVDCCLQEINMDNVYEEVTIDGAVHVQKLNVNAGIMHFYSDQIDISYIHAGSMSQIYFHKGIDISSLHIVQEEGSHIYYYNEDGTPYEVDVTGSSAGFVDSFV